MIRILFIIILCFSLPTSAWGVLAFPSAEGYGRDATGGRSGVVVQVTNLNNSGSGSLRACMEDDAADGARTCVFTLGGTIDISAGGEIDVDVGQLTVAGQTAPGGGIAVKGGMIEIHASNVIIRHIRIRPGLSIGAESASSNDAVAIFHNTTAFTDVILDHVSLSWAQDEVFSTWANASQITIQHSIISEPLHVANHSQGAHGKCVLLGSTSDDISVHHNLIQHCPDRIPEHQSNDVDWVNNVIYHFRDTGSNFIGNGPAALNVNIVGNRYVQHPTNNYTGKPVRLYNADNQVTAYLGEVDASGNIDDIFRTSDSDPVTDNQRVSGSGANAPVVTATRFSYPQINTTSAAQALIDVKANAGANLCTDGTSGGFTACQDSIDAGLITSLNALTGSIMCASSCAENTDFTYPTLATGTAYTDADADGMPAAWETANGLSDSDASDRNGDAACDNDGYTNLEEYLNQSDPGCATPPGGETFTQQSFGFFGPNLAEGIFPVPEDQNISIPSPGRADLRLALSCTGADCVSRQFDLYCREDAGAYTLVSTDCSGAMSMCLSEHTVTASGTATTNKLSLQSLTFVAGEFVTGNPPPPQYPTKDLAEDRITEFEFALATPTSVSIGTTFDCRLEETGGTDLDAYDSTPRITIRSLRGMR